MTTTKTLPGMQPWLRQHLIDTGRWSTDGITTAAQLRTHTCGLIVLTGLDATLAAIPTTVDPAPLTTAGEMAALLQGRHTYDFWTTTSELHGPRRAWDITRAPATNTGRTRVLATHICGSTPLPSHPTPAPATEETTDACPF